MRNSKNYYIDPYFSGSYEHDTVVKHAMYEDKDVNWMSRIPPKWVIPNSVAILCVFKITSSYLCGFYVDIIIF